MKKQVVYIHGGETWKPHEDVLKILKSMKVEKEDFMPDIFDKWNKKLQEALGKGFEVFRPEMPNSDISRYTEWKVWFDKLMPFLRKEPVFIGGSLGGIFLAKYFSENPDRKHMKAMFLVAPPYADADSKEDMADFILPKDMSRLNRLGSKVHLYFNEQDPVVDFGDLKKYRKALPKAKVTTFNDKEIGHFRVKDLPHLTRDILHLYTRSPRSRGVK